MKDLKNILNPVVALAPANLKNTTASSTVDTFGYEGVLFEITLGPTGDTLSGAQAFEFDVQDSPDGTTWSAVASQFLLYPAAGAANANAIAFVSASDASAQVLTGGYIGIQRYVRVNVVVTGTMTDGTTIGINAVLGFARHLPPGTQKP